MKPILMIVTSHAKLGDTGKPTGIWAEELTTPYYALIDAGYSVQLASPLGGTPPFADGSVKTPVESNEGSVRRFLLDAKAMAALNAMPRVSALAASDFAGVFLPGGHGTMWDTATDAHVAQIVGAMFDAGAPVAAVCHGPAGLVRAARADGKPIVFGRKVNGFTNEEETAVGLMDVVPFHLESTLKAQGGAFVSGPMWGAFAVRDGNLITGQNPASSALVAQHFVEALQGK